MNKHPKQVAAAAVLAAVTGTAHANGFGILTQSGSALGNAYAGGAAAAEDASTIWYNPAGMLRLEEGRHGSVALHAVKPSFKFGNTASTGAFAFPGTGDGGDGGDLSPVPQAYAAMSLGADWRVGVGLNSPFGLKTEYDPGWRGQFTALKSAAKSYNLNPSIAYRLSDAVWVGGGISVQRFETELTNFAGPVLGGARLEASDTSWGFNLGAMFHPSRAVRIGVAYRSRIDYRLEGTASFSGGGGTFNSGAQADLTVPESASLSVVSTAGRDWEIMANAIWTRWSRLQTVTVTRASPSALGAVGSVITRLPFNWSDTVLVTAGANYKHSDDWTIRFGVGYDPAAANDMTRTARLPDQSRLMLTTGASYRQSKDARLDIAYAHEIIKDSNIHNTVTGVPGALVGRFKNRADVLSIQYNRRF